MFYVALVVDYGGEYDISWISGLLLMVFAIIKL